MVWKSMLACAAGALLASIPAGVGAQDRASSYSMGTYNPVQAAINRNSLNAAIIRQATGGSRHSSRNHRSTNRRHHR